MKRLFVAGLLVTTAAGCSPEGLTNAGAPAGTYQMSGASGCYTVSGVIAQLGLFPSFAGTISGDIEGSVTTALDPAALHASGVVSFSAGVQTWQVTGGAVPELVGKTVRLAIESEVVFADPPIGRNNTRARVLEGAESGNLTYHGTLAVIPPPPFQARVDYMGVICP